MSVCISVTLPKWQKMTKNDKKWQKMTKKYKKWQKIQILQTNKETNKQRGRESGPATKYLLYQASIIFSRWIISFINARYNRMYLETHLS